jgi:hypothetical protein
VQVTDAEVADAILMRHLYTDTHQRGRRRRQSFAAAMQGRDLLKTKPSVSRCAARQCGHDVLARVLTVSGLK